MFKKIDPSLIYSDEILNWSLFETRAYLVFASYANMNSGEFFIKHETLAKKIGSSKRQAERIISKFNNKGIISIEQRSARSSIYTFNISTMSTLQSEVPSQSISKNDPMMSTLIPPSMSTLQSEVPSQSTSKNDPMMSTQNDIIDENQSTKTPEIRTTSQFTPCRSRSTSDKPALQADPHDQNKPKIEADVDHNNKQHNGEAYLTTTDKDLDSYNYQVRTFGKEVVVVFEKSVRKEEETVDMKFDWIDDLSLESLIKKHGEKYVLDRAIPINRANGKIKDKKACLEDSLKLGYIYTCKELKEQEQKEKHKKYVDEQIEKNRLEQEERERSFSERDPEAVKKLIEDCIANLGNTKPITP